MKRSGLDRLFSLFVRFRADWTCERCGEKFEVSARNLHCSHFRSRRYTSTRWHPSNAASHCARCHRYLGDHPHEFGEWIKSHLGEAEYQSLRELSNVVTRLGEHERKKIAADLRKWLHFIEERRKDGVVGRIEADWEEI